MSIFIIYTQHNPWRCCRVSNDAKRFVGCFSLTLTPDKIRVSSIHDKTRNTTQHNTKQSTNYKKYGTVTVFIGQHMVQVPVHYFRHTICQFMLRFLHEICVHFASSDFVFSQWCKTRRWKLFLWSMKIRVSSVNNTTQQSTSNMRRKTWPNNGVNDYTEYQVCILTQSSTRVSLFFLVGVWQNQSFHAGAGDTPSVPCYSRTVPRATI